MVTRKKGIPNRKKPADRLPSGQERRPVKEFRDKLTLTGQDPRFVYRFVKDSTEMGNRILRFLQAGYVFVKSDEEIEVGENYVHKSDNVGSIIRVPAGETTPDRLNWLYLMKVKKEWYDEDQRAKAEEIDAVENTITQPRNDLGQYGEVKLSR